jgi:hypothetical protein
VRLRPAQKVDGDNGPSPLGRRQHLPAASGVPPNIAVRVGRSQPPVLPAWPVVKDLLSLPLAERLKLAQALWDSIAAERGDPGLDAEAVLGA